MTTNVVNVNFKEGRYQQEFKQWQDFRLKLEKKIFALIESHYPGLSLLAFSDFYKHHADIEEDMSPDNRYAGLFMPWYLYQWISDEDGGYPPFSLAMHYTLHATELSDEEDEYIYQASGGFSFYELYKIDEGLRFRDLLTGQRHLIRGSGSVLSKNYELGEIFFGKIVKINGISVPEACGPGRLRNYKAEILGLKDALIKEFGTIDSEILIGMHRELMDFYLILDKRFMEATKQERGQ